MADEIQDQVTPEPEAVEEPQDTAPAVDDSNDDRPLEDKYVSLDKHLKAKDRLKAAEAELEQLREADKQRKREKLDEIERLKLDVEESKARAIIADEFEQTIKETLESEIESIPESKRSLIPDELPPHKQLKWIARNRLILVETPKAQPTVADAKPKANGTSKPVNLTPEQKRAAHVMCGTLGITPEEAEERYAKGL